MPFTTIVPFVVGLSLWFLIVVPVPSYATTPEKKESSEEHITQLKKEAAEDARRELATGNRKQYRSSEIGNRTYAYDWDPETGLQIFDMGLIGNPTRDREIKEGVDEYNRVVKEWIAEHGLPAGSMKPRFVTAEIARKELKLGSSLGPNGKATGSQGKVIHWIEPTGLSNTPVAQLVAESNGKMVWSRGIPGTKSVRVVLSDPRSWFIEFPAERPGERGSIWYVDADGAGVLQTFDLPAK